MKGNMLFLKCVDSASQLGRNVDNLNWKASDDTPYSVERLFFRFSLLLVRILDLPNFSEARNSVPLTSLCLVDYALIVHTKATYMMYVCIATWYVKTGRRNLEINSHNFIPFHGWDILYLLLQNNLRYILTFSVIFQYPETIFQRVT